MFKKIAVIGVGLIGGSFALACRKNCLAETITGCGRSEENLKKGVELGVIDDYSTDVREAVKGADLIFLSTPLLAMEGLLKKIAPLLSGHTVLTDGGSAKAELVKLANRLFPKGNFVGGHPIAGTEKSGVEVASDSLFEGAKSILTPTPETNPGALEKIKRLWSGIGSRVLIMDPATHDKLLAMVSHLPHVVAYALVNAVGQYEIPEVDVISLTGGGFKDFTRIASSHPVMWRDICLQNKENLLEVIEIFQEQLTALKNHIQTGNQTDLESDFARAKRLRESLI
ncbi:MAG: prephenate dehydrogenase [bacterium]